MKNSMIRVRTGVILGGVLLCFAGTGFAMEISSGTREHLRKMDSNGDGKLSPREHAAGAKAMFVAMDPDGSDTVTVEEMDEAKRVRHDQPVHGEISSAEKIAVIDADKDGSLSLQEHETGSQTMFDKMDKDADGFVTVKEMQSGHDEMMTKKI